MRFLEKLLHQYLISLEDAQKGTQRKIKNLSGKKEKKPTLNFAGISNELICDGGEYRFI
ncbi:MAG: RlmF-related methyltransferase, partial [Candidatus Heimdallarchaeota archaeon]|nr:RlmF-related methyltransferase [Candidatus Heimdallarchaeota archaeon]